MAFLLLGLLIFLKVKTQWIVFVPASIASVTMGVGAWFPEEFNEDCVDVFGGEFGEGRQRYERSVDRTRRDGNVTI